MQNVLSIRSSTQYSRKKAISRGSISVEASNLADEIVSVFNNVAPYDITTPAPRATLQRANSTADRINQAAEKSR
jgi:hypothetical protein